MTETEITEDMIVADVLDMVPDSEAIFTEHGVNPREECGPGIYTMNMEEAGRDCGIDDLDSLIEDLEAKLEEGQT